MNDFEPKEVTINNVTYITESDVESSMLDANCLKCAIYDECTSKNPDLFNELLDKLGDCRISDHHYIIKSN